MDSELTCHIRSRLVLLNIHTNQMTNINSKSSQLYQPLMITRGSHISKDILFQN